MNRVVVWVLGVISGVLLVYSVLTLSGSGYGMTSGCVSYGSNPAPCTPTMQTLTVGSPFSLNPMDSAGLAVLLLAILIGLPAWIGSPILARRRGSSSRAAILIVSVIASAFVILSIVSPIVFSPALTSQETCVGSGGFGEPCFTGASATVVALLGIGLKPLIASIALGMPAWVMALTETARQRRWGWFVAVLLFSPFTAMLYGFLGGRSQPPAPVAESSLAASGA